MTFNMQSSTFNQVCELNFYRQLIKHHQNISAACTIAQLGGKAALCVGDYGDHYDAHCIKIYMFMKAALRMLLP